MPPLISVLVRLKPLCFVQACASLLLALAGCAAHAAKAQAPAPTYLCPGNLVTNQLDPAQALVQKCTPAGPGRLSQASYHPSTAALAPLPREVAAPASAPAGPTKAKSSASTQLAARRADPPVPREDVAAQRARDSDARAILQSELARTLAQLQALSARADGGPDARAAADRLRADEAALRRELARLPI